MSQARDRAAGTTAAVLHYFHPLFKAVGVTATIILVLVAVLALATVLFG